MKRVSPIAPCRHSLLAVALMAGLAWGNTANAQTDTDAAESAEAAGAETAEGDAEKAEPSAESIKRAASHFERGLELYNDAEYGLALIEFERAYHLVPNYRVKYNIAQVSIQIGRYAHALHALQDYLEEGGDKISEERKAQVAADLRMLAGRTARVGIAANVEGAEIVVDDKVVANTPLEDKLLIDAGEHRIALRLRGYETQYEQVTLAGGDEIEIPFELKKEQRKDPVVIVKPGTTGPAQPTDLGVTEKGFPYATVSWIATGGLAVGAVVTGIVGLTAKDELESLSNPDPEQDPEVVKQEMDSARDKARNWFLASDILKGAALVSGVTALYFTFSGPSTEKPKVRKAGRAQPQPLSVGASYNQVWIEGTF